MTSCSYIECLLTIQLTDCMEVSPCSEAHRSSATKDIPHILWSLKVHYRIHKRPPPVPVLSQIDPIHGLPSNFSKVHFNIILPCTSGLSKWSTSLRFPHPVSTSPHTCYMSYPYQSSRFDQSNDVCCVQSMKLLIM